MFRFVWMGVMVLLVGSCSSNKQTVVADEVPESIANKLMIELRPGIDPDIFAGEFAEYALEKKYLASKSKNMHMYEFDVATIEIDELISKISRKKSVVTVYALSDHLETSASQSQPKKTIEVK